ncbi:hypothetical protein ONZ51_g9407 [Trametes cubensis]|uniref:Uncharacterized protein n=1 Tax=Trametes cubensis TaxID=1111947 RepID=A0AAD7TMP0_9APHY|nr:hypothetical protein ONZ51_g9407 [Trametes cubensis]
MFARFFLFALLAVPAVLAAGTPSPLPDVPTRVRRDTDSLVNPTGVVTRSLPLSPADAHGLTNAQRLARGLPPRSPRFNTRRRALQARQSATPCSLTQVTGIVQIDDAASGNSIGYLSRTANAFGEYELTTDASAALSVALRRCDSLTDPFELGALNGLADYPYVGGVTGFANSDDNLQQGSGNYVYLSGTSSVPRGPAQNAPNAFSQASGRPEDVESAIWTVPDNVNADAPTPLVPAWVNTDGSVASGTVIAYVASSDAFVLTGDQTAFSSRFGAVQAVTFTFVPNSA